MWNSVVLHNLLCGLSIMIKIAKRGATLNNVEDAPCPMVADIQSVFNSLQK